MTKIRDITPFLREHNLAIHDDEGFRFGPVDEDITGVLMCFKPTLDAMQAAHEAGCNLIVTHEELNFPPVYGGGRVEDQLSGTVTLLRVRRLLELEITVLRVHASLDRLCVLDEFGRALELGEPTIHGDYWERTYEIAPILVRDLALAVKERLHLETVRVVGDLEREVRRVALPWGGVAISANPNCIQTLLSFDPDVLITGETEEIPMHAALDAGVPLIETGHSESESPGIRRLAEMFSETFPGIRVEFYQNPRPWSMFKPLGFDLQVKGAI
jgi:putative NIF3 family GTP cyclohydrolase 1 type 2